MKQERIGFVVIIIFYLIHLLLTFLLYQLISDLSSIDLDVLLTSMKLISEDQYGIIDQRETFLLSNDLSPLLIQTVLMILMVLLGLMVYVRYFLISSDQSWKRFNIISIMFLVDLMYTFYLLYSLLFLFYNYLIGYLANAWSLSSDGFVGYAEVFISSDVSSTIQMLIWLLSGRSILHLVIYVIDKLMKNSNTSVKGNTDELGQYEENKETSRSTNYFLEIRDYFYSRTMIDYFTGFSVIVFFHMLYPFIALPQILPSISSFLLLDFNYSVSLISLFTLIMGILLIIYLKLLILPQDKACIDQMCYGFFMVLSVLMAFYSYYSPDVRTDPPIFYLSGSVIVVIFIISIVIWTIPISQIIDKKYLRLIISFSLITLLILSLGLGTSYLFELQSQYPESFEEAPVLDFEFNFETTSIVNNTIAGNLSSSIMVLEQTAKANEEIFLSHTFNYLILVSLTSNGFTIQDCLNITSISAIGGEVSTREHDNLTEFEVIFDGNFGMLTLELDQVLQDGIYILGERESGAGNCVPNTIPTSLNLR